MTILALDLGTTTGFALKPADGVVISGTWSFKPARFEGGGMRYVRFREQLGRMRANSTLGRVYFEEVRRHLGVDAAHAYGGFLAHLTAWCEENAIPYAGVPVGTIKKAFTGKGNASKDEMIAEAVRRGYSPADDNEADAIAILEMHLEGMV